MNACDLLPADLPRLPERMRELIRLIGIEAAVDLSNALGGLNISFPKHEAANRCGAASFRRLAEIVGNEATRALCAEYGGERIAIPRCHAWRAEVRARTIRRAFDAGATVPELARLHGITYRTVEKTLNGSP